MDFTSDPASGSVTATAAMSSPEMMPGRYFLICPGDPAFTRCVHENGNREAAEGGAAKFLGQQRRRTRIQRAAAELFRITQAEETQLAHAAQDFTRHESLLFPGVRLGNDFPLDEATDAFAQEAQRVVEFLRRILHPRIIAYPAMGQNSYSSCSRSAFPGAPDVAPISQAAL